MKTDELPGNYEVEESAENAIEMLGKGYKKPGFQSPNYTQTPNDFFAMIPDMEETEIRVTLVMIRKTFGFHRDGFKMGVAKLAAAAGLSRQGALDGAEAAEKRGTFKRSNPEEIKEAEWELVVPLYSLEDTLQPVEGTPPTSRGQSGVKESIKKESKKDMLDAILESERQFQPIKDATSYFESIFGFGVLNWDSKPEWRKFALWITGIYKDDASALRDYTTWRNGDGKYQAMSNNKIRQNPQMFMDTGWPTFLAHTAMYGKKETTDTRKPMPKFVNGKVVHV